MLLRPTFETLKRTLQNVSGGADGEPLTIPVQQPDDDDEKEKLRTTNNADGDECRHDREGTDYTTTKII